MKFQYHNPIRFSFGPDSLERLPELCKDRKVLLVYGGGSIKRNGIYERIAALLDGAGIPHLDYGNQVKATWQGVLDGIGLVRREGVDAVVEIGGASAWFIGNHENDIAKGFAGTVLRTLLESYEALLEDPDNERARGNVMWASCVNTMGVFRSGVDQFYPWTVFSVSCIPRVAHQVSYREALVVACLHWLRGISEYHKADIRTLFTEVFGVDNRLEDAEVVEQGCAKLRDLMERGGVSLSFASYGPCPTREFVEKSLAKENYGEFTHEEMVDMISACYA